VKSLWIEKQAASGMEHPEEFDASDYDFIPARVTDNPIYAGDANYLKTLRALPSHLKRAFLDGDWDVYAGQYFDRFDCSRHVVRAEQIEWKPWWPRWISVDWGFEHPAAVYWHAQVPAGAVPFLQREVVKPESSTGKPEGRINQSEGLTSKEVRYIDPAFTSASQKRSAQDDTPRRIVTYREFVRHRMSPRDLARTIVERSLCSAGVSPTQLEAQVNLNSRQDAGATRGNSADGAGR
jgi:hypothetical protein